MLAGPQLPEGWTQAEGRASGKAHSPGWQGTAGGVLGVYHADSPKAGDAGEQD